MLNERQTIDRGWYYVVEPEAGRWAPEDRRIEAGDGRILSRRLHGHPARAEVVDASGVDLPTATLLRAAGAVGAVFEARGWTGRPVVVSLEPAGAESCVDLAPDGRLRVRLDGPHVASLPSHHPLEAAVTDLLAPAEPTPRSRPVTGSLPARPAPRALFFESLMNTDMPHNDKEISQGVLHMISTLAAVDTEVVLVNAKMPIEGEHRPVHGLDRLAEALASGPVHLVGITLLEGYWEGVVKLIRTLRSLGCRAHIAVGGVMPSLSPEHVAAHLDDVTFICRGAGEAFLPSLARILGTSTIDDPFDEAQQAALLDMDGMIVVDRAGRRLLSCRSDRTLKVEDLDRVPLDLSHVTARHIEGGIELSTSRGCIHRCSFCSILGRESYQARSAGGIFDVLAQYEGRFRELHGDHVPDNAYRVHISDDDFACDKPRAKAFFEGLRDTRFRLSSVQVSVADLCRREGRILLPEPDHDLLDAMRADCFADHGRPIPKTDFYEDHKSRDWSSFLQIGVETYDDREIARLGKGYKRVHIRVIVAELARRSLHMDGYFILSNVDTTARDLVNVFSEVARLKLRFPEHFHMRFPVVQHLVSYFTAATHRKLVRQGRTHLMKLRGHAHTPGHPEFDYPFVDHDIPEDAWVARTVEHRFVTDQGMYTGNLGVLSAMWRTWLEDLTPDDPERARIARLLRKLDDRPRRLVFEMLRQAWFQEDEEWPGARLDREACLRTAERVLGPHDAWLPVLRAYLKGDRERRLVLALGGADAVTHAALECLAASDQEAVALHLMAPHGPVREETVVRAVEAATARAADPDDPKALRVVLDADALPEAPTSMPAWLRACVDVQFVRRVDQPDVPACLGALQDAGVPVRALLQIPAGCPQALPDAFRAMARAGVPEVCLEPLPEGWDAAAATRLGEALHALVPELSGATELVLDTSASAARSGQFGEVLVDVDGTIGRSDGLVPGTGMQRSHRLGRLDELTNVDRHHLEVAGGLSGVTSVEVQRKRRAPADQVIARFARWVRGRLVGPVDATTLRADEAR